MTDLVNEITFRSRSYNDTLLQLARFRDLVGITRLANLSYLDYSGLPVYTAIRPRAKSLSTSQGKGLIFEAAQCSALMESIEVYFAEQLEPEVCNKSEDELIQAGRAFIPVNQIAKSLQFSDSSQKMNWITAELLFGRQSVLVPFAEFSLNSYLPEVLIYSPETTGLAGGNTYNEALLHGILEVIERQEPITQSSVLIDKSELLENLVSHFDFIINFHENNYNLPSFDVYLKAKSPFENQMLFKGSGCHLNKKIALNRACAEAIQSRVTTIAGSREDLIDSKYDKQTSELPLLTTQREFNTIPEYAARTIEEALSVLYDKIKKNNQDILVYTYYEKSICVLKVKLISRALVRNA